MSRSRTILHTSLCDVVGVEYPICELFDGGWPAPHRVLRNKAVAEWEAAGRPASGQRPGEGTIVGTVVRANGPVLAPRYGASMPTAGDTGDLEYFPLYCGEPCTLVNDIKPAGDVVREIVGEAESVLQSRRGGNTSREG